MWIILNNAFLSIVHTRRCRADQLLVRARRPGDIKKVFPGVKVEMSTKTDYRYRALVTRKAAADAIANEVSSINYDNFKDSIKDKRLHDACLRVWSIMSTLQPTKPYSGLPNVMGGERPNFWIIDDPFAPDQPNGGDEYEYAGEPI